MGFGVCVCICLSACSDGLHAEREHPPKRHALRLPDAITRWIEGKDGRKERGKLRAEEGRTRKEDEEGGDRSQGRVEILGFGV